MPEYRLQELWHEKERERGERISWRQLANETSTPVSVIQKILKGEHVSTRTLEQIAQYFNVPIKDLFK